MVGGILPLRHDTFEAELAGMGEDGRAMAFDMLVEPDAEASLNQDRCERDPCGPQADHAAGRRPLCFRCFLCRFKSSMIRLMVSINSSSRSLLGRVSSARSLLVSLASKSLSFCRMSTGFIFRRSLYE
jgi:hypothetical protein